MTRGLANFPEVTRSYSWSEIRLEDPQVSLG